MYTQPKSRERVVFGDYQLDCRTGELRRNGDTLKLQPQPAKVLSILASRAGEVVTREELAEQVWGSDTNVDFEHGLNFAIGKIRAVLGDDADSPSFLETIPKRGYRFIAPVTTNGHAALPVAVAPEAKMRSWRMAVVASVVVIILGVAALVWRLLPVRGLAPKAAIVLGDFVNRTGDVVFDQTLRQGLSVQLEQSPFLRFVSDDDIHDTLRMMGRATDSALSPEIAREVCQRTNATVTFAGSIDQIGTRYALNLRAVECANGNLLASSETEASDKDHVLDSLSKLASDIRGKLGEPLSSVRQYDVPLASVTTPSLQALRCYTEGMQVLSSKFDYTGSLSWFQKAVELDPKFAMAYWSMGDVYAILGETNAAIEDTRKAFELREGVSQRENALIEANYYYYVLGDVEKARRACEFLGKVYPFSQDAHNSVAVFAETVGQYDVGLAEYQEALRLAPRRRAEAMNLDANLAAVRYSIAFYRGDQAEMSRQVAHASGKPEIENLLLALDADSAAYAGQLGRARELSRRAAESAEREGKRETSALYYSASAVREALLGKAERARENASIASKYPGGRDVAFGNALSFLYGGDLKQGQSATEDLAKRFPEDTIVNCNYLPTLKAKIAILQAKPQQAVDLLASAEPCELGLPVYSYYNWPNLYPAYVRGEAYLAGHRASEAAAEFEKVLGHRGLVLNEPIGVLAHLQLGRAYVMSGDLTKARAAYRMLFDAWKDADPDIPSLMQAKSEYGKLFKTQVSRADAKTSGGTH